MVLPLPPRAAAGAAKAFRLCGRGSVSTGCIREEAACPGCGTAFSPGHGGPGHGGSAHGGSGHGGPAHGGSAHGGPGSRCFSSGRSRGPARSCPGGWSALKGGRAGGLRMRNGWSLWPGRARGKDSGRQAHCPGLFPSEGGRKRRGMAEKPPGGGLMRSWTLWKAAYVLNQTRKGENDGSPCILFPAEENGGNGQAFGKADKNVKKQYEKDV